MTKREQHIRALRAAYANVQRLADAANVEIADIWRNEIQPAVVQYNERVREAGLGTYLDVECPAFVVDDECLAACMVEDAE